jgi:hypothetical protein
MVTSPLFRERFAGGWIARLIEPSLYCHIDVHAWVFEGSTHTCQVCRERFARRYVFMMLNRVIDPRGVGESGRI